MELYIEILAVVLNLIYLYLLIKEKIACWYFGIAGSVLSIYLFYSIGLYSESILYVYYVVIGVYGYSLWKKGAASDSRLKIKAIGIKKHVIIIIGSVLVALLVGWFFKNNTDAVNPYLDAFTTVFSFVASFLEAKKLISSWVFWMVINTATIVLYAQQELYSYLFLTIVYVVFSVIGFIKWRKKMTGYVVG
tara:strand:+ start:10397 stop:10969 length:573 start_codon:yes stop_codon:yes gene_type:complete